MGWIKSPPYFCKLSETGRDVTDKYVETPVGSLAPHKFVNLMGVNPHFAELPQIDRSGDPFKYMLELYRDDYIELALPRSRDQLNHIANTIITGINYVFPPYKNDDEDAISLSIFRKRWALGKLLKMCWDLTLMVTKGSIHMAH